MTDDTTANNDDPSEDELLIDTSKMSEGKRAAMEVAEGARETAWDRPGFAHELFMGHFNPELMTPFPVQPNESKEETDALISELDNYLTTNLDAAAVDDTQTIPQAVMDGLVQRGIFAMKIPKEYGGLGLSQVNYNRIMMMIASHCASTAVLVSAHQSIGVPQPLKMFGTDEQKKKYLPKFREGWISAFALTEPNVGSDPAQMSTTAVPSEDGSHWIINGEKLWCTNGPIADVLVVMAKTPAKIVNGRERQQITAFIVEKSFGGIETKHRCDFMGIRGIQNGLLQFTNVKVPTENIIGGLGRGLKLALSTLNFGRLTLPAACAGVGKQCLHIARRWGNERVQWGLPIGKHEAGSQKLAYIAANTFAMEAVTMLTSHWADRGDVDIRIEAAMAKLFCSVTAERVVDQTMQLRGGRGYERATSLEARGELPFPVERMYRDIRINSIIEGTSEIMRLFLAREAMDPHLKVAADILKRHSSLGTKLRGSMKLATFYSTWYPSQWINDSIWSLHEDMGPLAEHYRFCHKTAHKLARTIFHYMGLYQDKLERKQMILGHLMDIGTELFAMTATCSYALTMPRDMSPIRLADCFCHQAILRIEQHFHDLSTNNDANNNDIAKEVLTGSFDWLEEGVHTWPEKA